MWIIKSNTSAISKLSFGVNQRICGYEQSQIVQDAKQFSDYHLACQVLKFIKELDPCCENFEVMEAPKWLINQ